MITSGVIAALAIVLLVLLGALIKKTWCRVLLTLALYLCIVFVTTFGMGGLRVSIEQARAQGKSEEYVQGMAARNKHLASARLEILIFGSGLMVLSLLGWVGLPKRHRKS